MNRQQRHAAIVIIVATIVGALLRYHFRAHTTPDTFKYLLPWYESALTDGLDSLRHGVTNYAPFYEYLLLLVTKLDGVFPPLLLVKSISFAFEAGCAVMVGILVSAGGGSQLRSALAFATVWLAPSVIYNGAMWGQSDSVWTFFVLLAIYLICRKSFIWAAMAFSTGVSVKFQAVFLGPLICALVLQRRLHWAWLAAVPAVYLVVALPSVVLGRPLLDVLTIYLDQATFFRLLSRGAANPWLFVPRDFYGIGVPVGVGLGIAVGLIFSIVTAGQREWSPRFVLIAAAVLLQLMPWVLPKMHDRYFYGFEVSVIAAAFVEPRLAPVALVAQINAVLSYLPFDIRTAPALLGTPLAAILNTVALAFMVVRLHRGTFNPHLFAAIIVTIGSSYLVWLIVLVIAVPVHDLHLWWPAARQHTFGFLIYASLLTLILVPIVARWRRLSRQAEASPTLSIGSQELPDAPIVDAESVVRHQ